MGFLDEGTPIHWDNSCAARAYVKKHGILQLIQLWRANKDRRDSSLRWGDELEFILVKLDNAVARASVHSDAASIIAELNAKNAEGFSWVPAEDHTTDNVSGKNEQRRRLWTCDAYVSALGAKWLPEFANYMVEATPGSPYCLSLESLRYIELNMRLRRTRLQSVLPSDVFVTSFTAFPRLGLPDSFNLAAISPPNPDQSVSRSIFIPDQIINPHPRFKTLVQNIRLRRRAKPLILIPLAQTQTSSPALNASKALESDLCSSESTNDDDEHFLYRTNDWSSAESSPDRFRAEWLARHKTPNPVLNQIYMDCFAFGMGMSCVQTTVATPDLDSARYLYDQLLVLAPFFLAMTASTPCLRGLLADTDTRWSVLEQAVDCRTEQEEKSGEYPKSRYSGASLYIGRNEENVSINKLNDAVVPINMEAKQLLLDAGVDEALANHFGYLWSREPMVIFSERVTQVDDATQSDHFENLQSTNWNSVRFKPPPAVSADMAERSIKLHPIGWRVEFRTPEIQLTEFDNAAYVALVSVLAQLILRNYTATMQQPSSGVGCSSYELHDIYIPMKCNDLNMQTSWKRDASLKEKFYFSPLKKDQKMTTTELLQTASDRCRLMSLQEIFLGYESEQFYYPGLIPMCRFFVQEQLEATQCSPEAAAQFNRYAKFIEARLRGELMTTAHFLRHFFTNHPTFNPMYPNAVSPTACYDAAVLGVNLGRGVWSAPNLHGPYYSPTLPANTVKPLEFSPILKQFMRSSANRCAVLADSPTNTRNSTSTIESSLQLVKSPPSPTVSKTSGIARTTTYDVVSTEEFSYHWFCKGGTFTTTQPSRRFLARRVSTGNATVKLPLPSRSRLASSSLASRKPSSSETPFSGSSSHHSSSNGTSCEECSDNGKKLEERKSSALQKPCRICWARNPQYHGFESLADFEFYAKVCEASA